jgi:ABC-type Na+ efflux pump permease subunit
MVMKEVPKSILILLIVMVVGMLGGWEVWLVGEKLRLFGDPAVAPDLFVTCAAPLLLFGFLLAGVALVGLLSRFTTTKIANGLEGPADGC